MGKKGYEHFYKRNYAIKNHYKDFWMSLHYEDAIKVGNDIVSSYVNDDVHSVKVIYNYFKNIGSQEIIFDSLLPLDFNDNENVLVKKDVIYEPNKTDIVKVLVPKYFNTQICQYLLESFEMVVVFV